MRCGPLEPSSWFQRPLLPWQSYCTELWKWSHVYHYKRQVIMHTLLAAHTWRIDGPSNAGNWLQTREQTSCSGIWRKGRPHTIPVVSHSSTTLHTLTSPQSHWFRLGSGIPFGFLKHDFRTGLSLTHSDHLPRFHHMTPLLQGKRHVSFILPE